MAITVTDTDTPPDGWADDATPPSNSDATSGGCAKEGCSNPLPEYRGRGARPKYCDDHRVTNRGKSGETPVASSGTLTDRYVKRIAEFYTSLAMALKFAGLATDAQLLALAADELAESWRGMLANPKVRKRWDTFLESTALMALLGTHVSFLLTIASGHGLDMPRILARFRKTEAISGE